MSTINILREFIGLLVSFLMIWFIYSDTKRIFKEFFLHVEKKLLIVQLLKLIIFAVIIYKLKAFIVFHKIIIVFTSIIFLLFTSMLSLKQVEITVKGFKNSKFRIFKYSNKFIEFILFIVTVFINFTELHEGKKGLKEKSKEIIYVAIFPVQKYIAISISKIKFTKRKEKFITDTELIQIKSKLLPGDILLKRNDWQATNLGISGFWTHTGIYTGTLEEMDKYFSDVDSLNGEKFSQKLKSENEEIYYRLLEAEELEVIEAIREGVTIKSISNIAKVDYFSALRPRISKEAKMKAILKAYSFVGCPYDYHFNINSNDAFICTEVIKKSFESSISFQLEKRMGKNIILPNSIAKKFVQEKKKKNRKLDFVLFYDLNIKTRKAFKSCEKEFARSPKRTIGYYKRSDMLRYLYTIL